MEHLGMMEHFLDPPEDGDEVDPTLQLLLTHAARGEETAALDLLDHNPALLHQAWSGQEFRPVEENEDDLIDGDNVFMTSCLFGRLSLARALATRGSDVRKIVDVVPGATNGGWDALSLAAWRNHLYVVKFLLSVGVDPNAVTDRNHIPLLRAANKANHQVCVLLLANGANLLVDKLVQPILDTYGSDLRPPLSEDILQVRRAALVAAWEAGPHPSQVQRRKDENWARRSPLLLVLASHDDFLPLAARRAELLELHPALPTNVAIPPLPAHTPQLRRALQLVRIFGHLGLVKIVASYL